MRVSGRKIGVCYGKHHSIDTIVWNAGRPHERLSTKPGERIGLAGQLTAEDALLDRGLLEISTSK